jgi:hypothetical protein
MTTADKMMLAHRMSFLIEALTLRELRGWPNDPVHNAVIIYSMYGWSFDELDAALIREERQRAREETSHD